MMSLTMMGLDRGPLVRALFHFALEILLVISVAYDLEFLFRLESSQLVTFLRWSCSYQEELSPKLIDS